MSYEGRLVDSNDLVLFLGHTQILIWFQKNGS